ncbi:MAG: hypothetical protein PHX51_04155 [Clostridia bacterium]|nr:hypothetical protein [Clostridia bacterium]
MANEVNCHKTYLGIHVSFGCMANGINSLKTYLEQCRCIVYCLSICGV